MFQFTDIYWIWHGISHPFTSSSSFHGMKFPAISRLWILVIKQHMEPEMNRLPQNRERGCFFRNGWVFMLIMIMQHNVARAPLKKERRQPLHWIMRPIFFVWIQFICSAESLYLSTLLSGALLAKTTMNNQVIHVGMLFKKSSRFVLCFIPFCWRTGHGRNCCIQWFILRAVIDGWYITTVKYFLRSWEMLGVSKVFIARFTRWRLTNADVNLIFKG